MTIDLLNALNRWRQGDQQAPLAVEKHLEPFLQEIVTRLRPYRELLLLEGIDCPGIARAALQSFLSSIPKNDQAQWQNWAAVRPFLDALVLRTCLADPGIPQGAARSANGTPGNGQAAEGQCQCGPYGEKTGQNPGAWLERFHVAMRGVHPLALDMLGLRLQSYSNRDLAQRLGLGLRLVERIWREMHLAWEKIAVEGGKP